MLTALKTNKARDPAGLVNELLSSTGAKLKKTLLDLFNTIKSKQVCPEFLNGADCVTIYKGKGKKDDKKRSFHCKHFQKYVVENVIQKNI